MFSYAPASPGAQADAAAKHLTGAAPAEKVIRVAFELARQPDGWKFRALSNLTG